VLIWLNNSKYLKISFFLVTFLYFKTTEVSFMRKITFLVAFLILTLLFLTSIVSAADFYYKRGEVIDLKINCFKSGANCDNSITCKLTTLYPNSTVFIDNAAMTYNTAYYSYEILDSNVTGLYTNSMVCSDGTTSTYSLFIFEINNRGNGEQSSIVNAFIILLPIIFGILLIIATFGLGEDHQTLKFGFLILALLSFIVSIGMAIVTVSYYSYFTSLIDTLGLWVYVYGCFYLLVVFYLILYLIVKMINFAANEKDRRLNY
jgi:hypothetical protein